MATAATLKADGASSVQYLGPNVPAYVGIVELVKNLLPQVGIEFAGSTLYPVEATDYTQYVASAYGSGADSVNVTFINSASVPAFVNAVEGGGYSFADTPTATFGSTVKPSVLQGQLSGRLDGLYVINAGQTPTDTSLPGIATFHSEVAAAGTPPEYTDAAPAVWTGVHAIARILATAEGDVTQASTVLAAARSAGPVQMPGWTPFDWSKPALPGDLAAAFPRYFNATVWISKIVNNAEVSAVSGPAPFTGPITLTAP